MAATLAFLACAQSVSASVIEVVKSPYCGCCVAWVERMREAGFTVKVREVRDTATVAKAAGIPDNLRSCHTSMVEGYAVEGHVPAADIKRLIKERPEAIGIAVPGMPLGSPGMEAGGQRDFYQVVLIGKDGQLRVFSTHGGRPDVHKH